jgi:hypothetical protein
MADPPDLSALAKRYVDLWQDQLIALAAHPELAEGLARVLAAFPFPSVTWPATGPASSHNGNAATAAPRTAPSAAAPGGGDHQLRQLARRLAALEERLSRLETGASGGGQRSRKKPRRRRP